MPGGGRAGGERADGATAAARLLHCAHKRRAGVGGAHSRLQVKGVRRAHLGGCGLGARLAVLRHAAPPRSRAAECGIAPLAWLRPSGLALLGPLASAS